jgi:hypothetical protein
LFFEGSKKKEKTAVIQKIFKKIYVYLLNNSFMINLFYHHSIFKCEFI